MLKIDWVSKPTNKIVRNFTILRSASEEICYLNLDNQIFQPLQKGKPWPHTHCAFHFLFFLARVSFSIWFASKIQSFCSNGSVFHFKELGLDLIDEALIFWSWDFYAVHSHFVFWIFTLSGKWACSSDCLPTPSASLGF